jgi:hypothetical protein
MAGCINHETELKPDHVIIWLDKNMGEIRNNRTSKIDLSNNVDIDSLPTEERKTDIDNLIRSCEENMNNEKFNTLIKGPLHMFTDEKECIQCINDSIQAKKRIFLISSGQMGISIVPKIHKILSGYIYIFCAYVEKHINDWAGNYIEDIQIFDEETTVFIRLLRDIARYYIKKSEETFSNQATSIKYLKWARRLVLRANKMDKEGGKMLLAEIENKLTLFEKSQSNDSDMDGEGKGTEADEG